MFVSFIINETNEVNTAVHNLLEYNVKSSSNKYANTLIRKVRKLATIHRSMQNRSDRNSKAVSMNASQDGCRCHEIKSPPLQSHRGRKYFLSPGGNISSPLC